MAQVRNIAVKRQRRVRARKPKKIARMVLDTKQIMELAGDPHLYLRVAPLKDMRAKSDALYAKVQQLMAGPCYGCRNPRLLEWYEEFAREVRRRLYEAHNAGESLNALKDYLLDRWLYEVGTIVIYYKDEQKVMRTVVV